MEGGEQLRQEQRVLLHHGSVPQHVVLPGPVGTHWHAHKHPALPSVLANLCCRGLGGHVMPKAVSAICCLSPFLHCPLPAVHTHISTGSRCKVDHFSHWDTEGVGSDPHLPGYGDMGLKGRKARPGRGKGHSCFFQ